MHLARQGERPPRHSLANQILTCHLSGMVESQVTHTSSRDEPEIDERSAGVIKAIWTLLGTLPAAERQRVLKQMAETLAPIPPKKGNELLGVVLKLIPKTGNWSIDDLKKQVLESTEDAKPKEIYNAVGYLARKGFIRRIGYGRYLTEDGHYLVTSDDCGGQRLLTEEDLDN